MFRPSYPLETERMLLRPYAPDDLDGVVNLFGRADVARYIPFGPLDRDEARQVLERRLGQTQIDEDGRGILLAAVLKTDPAAPLVGEFMLALTSERHRQGEVGWVIHPDLQGRGLGTEGARRMLRLGFEGLGLHRITAETDPRNAASNAVAERLGMRREAYLRENELIKGEWLDTYVYAILDRDWAARSTSS